MQIITQGKGSKITLGILLTAIALPMIFSPFLANAEVGGTITRGADVETTQVHPIAVIELVKVGPELKACTGVTPMKCMVVDGKYFYNTINGFDYEEGYNYELYITKTERKNVPADASRYVYDLVRIKSKTVAPSHPITIVGNDKVLQDIIKRFDIIIGNYVQLGEWDYENGTMTFTEDRFSVTTDCNTIAGDYTRDGFGISFDKIVSTKKICRDNDVMEAENNLIKTLESTKSFNLVTAGMVLMGDTRTITLTR